MIPHHSLWTREEVCEATQGGATDKSWSATGISIDSRTVQEGDLYIPIQGETVDGHDFIKQAFEKGAVASFIDHWPASFSLQQETHNFVQVFNTKKALWDLGLAARRRSTARIIAITGSVGKTTTKTMLAHMLSLQGITGFSEKSFNTKVGVPVSLAQMPRDALYGVFEIGMSMPGEIAPLSQLVAPDIALITMIAPGHLEDLKTLEGVADEKRSIITGLSERGILILNRDMPFYEYIRNQVIQKVVTYGEHSDADLQLLGYHSDGGIGEQVTAKFKEEKASFTYTIPLTGKHMVINSLGALLSMRMMGADVLQGAYALRNVEAVERRGRHYTVPLKKGGSIYLLDESYNANPASVNAALEVLSDLQKRLVKKRSIAILGDMKGLGEKSPEFHGALAKEVQRLNINHIFTCGPLMAELRAMLPKECHIYHAASSEDLIDPIFDYLQDDDIVMVKGSLSMKMGLIAAALREPKGNT